MKQTPLKIIFDEYGTQKDRDEIRRISPNDPMRNNKVWAIMHRVRLRVYGTHITPKYMRY